MGLFHAGFGMLSGGDVVGNHHGMGNLTATVPVRMVSDLKAAQFPAVELEPVLRTGYIAGKTIFEFGFDDRFELRLPPDIGNAFADDILMPLTPGPAIGLVDVFVGIIPVDHGEQLVGRIGNELGFAPGFSFLLQKPQLFPKGLVFR
jgi:hypothetical protein